MQAKQDYLTVHMLYVCRESTVQRLFRIECKTTYRGKNKANKQIDNLFLALGIWKRWKFTFLFGVPNTICPLKAPHRDKTEGLCLDSCLFE